MNDVVKECFMTNITFIIIAGVLKEARKKN